MNDKRPDGSPAPDADLMRRIRADWEDELENGSVDAGGFRQAKLLGESDENYVSREVERKLYIPDLPSGGAMERRIVDRLKKILRWKDFDDAWRAGLALKKWVKVLPEDPRNAGHYYTRTALTPRTSKDYDSFTERLKAAKEAKDWDRTWFYELMLDGAPESCSNFEIHCKFLLKSPDGEIQRMVEFRNDVGEVSGAVSMDCEAFHSPQKFRKFSLARGNFNWGAGEKELQKLHNDIGRLTAWRVVEQVVTLGWHPLGGRTGQSEIRRTPDGRVECDGIWFFGDCARANSTGPDGEPVDEWLKQDEEGIYWHRTFDRETGEPVEKGYLVSDTSYEGLIKVPFYQGKPLLHPNRRITDLPLELAPCPLLSFPGTEPRLGTKKAEGELVRDEARERLILSVFFREFCERILNSVGSEEAKLLIGGVLAYAAAPEIYAEHSLFPGLWVHGQANSGKSTIVEILMEVFGFSLHSGMMLKGNLVSAVGLSQCASQYSNLPPWADEHVNGEVDDDKLSVLHAGYNRQTPAKFNASGFRRMMRTNFIVSGESTSTKAAMRSRYPHIQMAATARKGTPKEQKENLQWLLRHRKYFHLFGRFIIENRREFVRLVQTFMESWSHEDIDARLRIMHGVGYSAWMAMASLLQSHTADEVSGFKQYLVGHSQRAQEDVQSDHNINVFMEELITAVKMDAIPWTCFKVQETFVEHAPGAPNQNRTWCPAKSPTKGWVSGWYEYVLLIDPDPTIAALNIWLTKQRQTLPLKRKDLRDQLGRCDYWYRKPDGRKISVRFGRGQAAATSHAWGIVADKHPLGYQPVSDEEWNEMDETKGDPRKGPLFSLIEWVLEKHRQADRDEEPDDQP